MIDPVLPHDRSVPVSRKTLRQFAGLWILFFVGLACWQGFGREAWIFAYLLAGLGASVGLMGLISPGAIRPFFVGAMKVTHPIGRLVSFVLLTLLFYLVFTPVGLIFRLIRRDALHLRRPKACDTYLTPKLAPAGVASYFRQS
jgi:hypothetical protein